MKIDNKVESAFKHLKAHGRLPNTQPVEVPLSRSEVRALGAMQDSFVTMARLSDNTEGDLNPAKDIIERRSEHGVQRQEIHEEQGVTRVMDQFESVLGTTSTRYSELTQSRGVLLEEFQSADSVNRKGMVIDFETGIMLGSESESRLDSDGSSEQSNNT